MAWRWSKVSGTDFLTWHMGWNGGPLENQYRISSCGFRSSPKGSNLASHLNTVAIPEMGIKIKSSEMGIKIELGFDNTWLWNICLVMRLFSPVMTARLGMCQCFPHPHQSLVVLQTAVSVSVLANAVCHSVCAWSWKVVLNVVTPFF